MAAQPISFILLTFNSSASIGRTLRSIEGLSDDVHVVDSGSTDDTLQICERHGCHIVHHPFDNYSAQRNWAIDSLPLRHAWQLHIDADEELTPELRSAVERLDLNATDVDGYIIGRKIVFLGKVLRFGGIAKTWHYRLFRTGFGRCEDRLYDQHFQALGRTANIDAFMLDHQEATLSAWTLAHNRWSDAEAREVLVEAKARAGEVAAKASGSRIERRRYLKGRYYRMPLFLRTFGYFWLRYLFLGGFLDGRAGLIWHVLQGFWFRFLVDAKIYEAQWRAAANPPHSEARSGVSAA